jgi:flagellar basal-body rod protein FlgF
MNNLMGAIHLRTKQVMVAQAVNANNLANASTDGFVAELLHISNDLDGRQNYSVPDLTRGPILQTGRELDASIQGEGWLAVLGPAGDEAYSRRGDFKIDASGILTDGAGHMVMGNNGPIALPPFETVTIGIDGTISIRPLGSQSNNLAVVDRIKLVNPDGGELVRGEDGLFRLPQGIPIPADATLRLQIGTLEGSNVNAVAELLKMMDLAREFESNFKLMQSSDENAKRLNSLMRLS